MKNITDIITEIDRNKSFEYPLAFGIGIRRKKSGKTLDVIYPVLNWESAHKTAKVIAHVLGKTKIPDQWTVFTDEQLKDINALLTVFASDNEAHPNQHLIAQLCQVAGKQTGYSRKDVGVFALYNTTETIKSSEDAYFRLQCLSQRKVKPHGIGLDGLFKVLPTIAWSNYGPLFPEDVDTVRIQAAFNERPLMVTHVDKFPYMVNYHIPSGVRIASGSQVRLGAYLGEGSTVMPSGYVNFNAGSEGNAMIEGRVSAGVVIGNETDIGGGASIMGTLSGGNKHVISIGRHSLLGANSGVGISLGNGCTVEAGLYITSGMKIYLKDLNDKDVDLKGNPATEGKNIVKAAELSGKDHLLFIRDSVTGHVICKPNQKSIELNTDLHANN